MGLPLRLPRRRAWAVTAVATLAMSVSYIDRQTLAALAPTVRTALGVTHEQYGAVLSAFSLAYLIGAPLAGAVLDRTGVRWGLVAALLAWSAVAAGHALVPGLAVLMVMRVLLGLAEAPSFPGALQAVRRVLPPAQRSAGVGFLFTGSSIGAMVAMPLAIAMNGVFGWRVSFLGTALVGLAWVPVWLLVTSGADVQEVLAPEASDEQASAAAEEPVSRWKLLAQGPAARAVMLVVFSAPTVSFGLNWHSQYLVDAFGLKQGELAPYLVFPPLFFDAGAVAFGALASRADARVSGTRTHTELMAAAALLCATMAAMPLAHQPWLATLLCATSLLGGGGVFALLTADLVARLPPQRASTAGGFTAAAQSLAYIVANPLVGRAVDAQHSYALALVLLGAVVPPAMVAWASWPVGAPAVPKAATTA